MPELMVLSNNNSSPEYFSIEEGKSFSIGRSRQNQLRLEHPKISKFHSLIDSFNGSYWMEDQGSTWGTYVNDTRIRTKLLRYGDLISFAMEISCRFIQFRYSVHADPGHQVNPYLSDPHNRSSSHAKYLPPSPSHSLLGRYPDLIQIDDFSVPIRSFPIKSRITRIGRSPSNSIFLKNKTISGDHCLIENINERYFITDLGSENGTWAHDEKILYHELSDNDTVFIGNQQFRFSIQT